VKLSEGSVAEMNVADGRFAIGILARVEISKSMRPYGIFVYFFGPFSAITASIFQEDELLELTPIARLKTSALDIYSGNWKLFGKVKPWTRSKWVFPNFFETNPLTGEQYFLKLDENDQITPIERRRIEVVIGLDENILYGSEAARRKVSALSKGMQTIILPGSVK
jgi:hypothetical protein